MKRISKSLSVDSNPQARLPLSTANQIFTPRSFSIRASVGLIKEGTPDIQKTLWELERTSRRGRFFGNAIQLKGDRDTDAVTTSPGRKLPLSQGPNRRRGEQWVGRRNRLNLSHFAARAHHKFQYNLTGLSQFQQFRWILGFHSGNHLCRHERLCK